MAEVDDLSAHAPQDGAQGIKLVEIRGSNQEESRMKTNPTPPILASSPISLTAMLTKEQAAAQMGISVRTLDGLVANGEFPRGVRVGRYLYWTEFAITAWQGRIFAEQLAWRP